MLAELLCAPTLALILTVAPDRRHAPVEPRPAARLGDVNEDGLVDFDDIIDHLFLWGPCDDELCVGDLDADGFVDALDFIELLHNLHPPPLLVNARAT